MQCFLRTALRRISYNAHATRSIDYDVASLTLPGEHPLDLGLSREGAISTMTIIIITIIIILITIIIIAYY